MVSSFRLMDLEESHYLQLLAAFATEHPELEGLLTLFICEFGPIFRYSLPILWKTCPTFGRTKESPLLYLNFISFKVSAYKVMLRAWSTITFPLVIKSSICFEHVDGKEESRLQLVSHKPMPWTNNWHRPMHVYSQYILECFYNTLGIVQSIAQFATLSLQLSNTQPIKENWLCRETHVWITSRRRPNILACFVCVWAWVANENGSTPTIRDWTKVPRGWQQLFFVPIDIIAIQVITAGRPETHRSRIEQDNNSNSLSCLRFRHLRMRIHNFNWEIMAANESPTPALRSAYLSI